MFQLQQKILQMNIPLFNSSILLLINQQKLQIQAKINFKIHITLLKTISFRMVSKLMTVITK